MPEPASLWTSLFKEIMKEEPSRNRIKTPINESRHKSTPFPEWPLNHSSQYAAGEAIGLNTFDALYSGCVSGASQIQGNGGPGEKHPNLGVILTGGDHSHLELRSILPKFADAFLTLKGYHALFHNILQQT